MAVRGKASKSFDQSRGSLTIAFVTEFEAIELSKLIEANFISHGARKVVVPRVGITALFSSLRSNLELHIPARGKLRNFFES